MLVRSLGGEDSLEKEMATHTSILAWEIPCTEEPGGLSSWGPKESDMAEQLSVHAVFVSGTGSSMCISKLLLLLLAGPKREFLSYLHRKNQ